MTGIVAKTQAIKITRRPGGYQTFTKVETIGLRRHHDHMITKKPLTGSDYIVFICPWQDCGKRNKQSAYEAKAVTPNKNIILRCNSCRREVEVEKPKPEAKLIVPSMISQPEGGGVAKLGLYGPDNKLL